MSARFSSSACGFLFLLISMSYASAVSATKVYSWTDANGNVHFGDKPRNQQADEIKLNPASGGDPSGRKRFERSKKLLDSLSADRKEREVAREAQQRKRQEKAAKCAQARTQLQELTEAQFIYDESDTGKKRILNFDERAQAEQDAAQKIRKICGGN
ncbi:MAG: DUF4124 domain-containing protein [Gammaproteobacteria bacterium]